MPNDQTVRQISITDFRDGVTRRETVSRDFSAFDEQLTLAGEVDGDPFRASASLKNSVSQQGGSVVFELAQRTAVEKASGAKLHAELALLAETILEFSIDAPTRAHFAFDLATTDLLVPGEIQSVMLRRADGTFAGNDLLTSSGVGRDLPLIDRGELLRDSDDLIGTLQPGDHELAATDISGPQGDALSSSTSLGFRLELFESTLANLPGPIDPTDPIDPVDPGNPVPIPTPVPPRLASPSWRVLAGRRGR